MSDESAPSVGAIAGGNSLALETALELVTHGDIDIQGLLPWSSNYTFLVRVAKDGLQAPAVYKPCKGERPLWDFPSGTLANREVAAHVVSRALGWMLVPPTVLRDGPHGTGMVQIYIHNDPDEHYFTLSKQFPDQFRRVAVFDALINNADRKSGHCLRDDRDHIWAIDHGICFHRDPKLRTVIWEFAGQPIPDELLIDLRAFRANLASRSHPATRDLARMLSKDELAALRQRADRLLSQARFPGPGRERHIPWPPV